ncbi:hypothetical protein ACQP1G_37630 [Nocardia sp. CA-107356]|uniref:hypothetical protein n=1 Tax=Nocardia sp. CA-107356 TaxID=3239972 RepID=UPI003D8DFE70
MVEMTKSNMLRPGKPFGDPGARRGSRRMVASMAVTDIGIGLVYVRFDADHPLDLNDGRGFVFDYELLDSSAYTPEVFGGVIDDRLFEIDLHAEVITGHDMLSGLAKLSHDITDPEALSSIDSWIQMWPERENVNACGDLERIMVDTAYDLTVSHVDLVQTCRQLWVHSWYLDPDRHTQRFPITTALASAVLAGREMGWCSWNMLDLDPLVTESIRRLDA